MRSRLVIDFADARPFWSLPGWVVERVRAALPPDWEVLVVPAKTDGGGDGSWKASPEALAAVQEAEIYMGFGVPPEILRAGPRLRWVHSGTAGVGGSLSPEMIERDVVFTNSAGVHAPVMAEFVLGAMLYFARGFDFAVRAQASGRWDKAPFDAAGAPLVELSRGTVGIFGYGGIGREIARRVVPLGASVLAVRRTAAPPEESGVELLSGDGALDTLLQRSDFLVLTAPATPLTRGIIGRDALSRMPQRAVLINVARGKLVDEDALVEALRTGRLRGAALDVFNREPLADGHPLWSLPNVLITPHVSAYSPHYWERATALIEENIRRYLDGRPLLNQVDKTAGY